MDMSVTEQSLSINSSGASLHNDVPTNVKNYVKDLIKSRLFLGRYTERRLVDKTIGYRDVVLLSPAETQFRNDLLEAKQKLLSVFPNKHWIGISDCDLSGFRMPGFTIWTEIDNQPFGAFWFQVKSVKYRESEVILILKCIRHITDAFLEVEPILTGSNKKKEKQNNDNTENITENISKSYNLDIVENLRVALSITNIKELLTFIFALVIAIFTGSTTFINFLGNFILALLREISIFIKNSTPMFIAFLEFLSKVVGGFYLLLAMLFRTNNPVPVNNRRTIGYEPTNNRSRKHYEYYDDSRDFD